jgi:8-oxo-dGTP diphosphatase
VIESAGGVVRRIDAGGNVLVLMVHRRRQDDWSLPKGKIEPGERHVDAALREVAEETGLVCAVREPLPPTRYFNRKGRAKRVRYWVMEAIAGTFVPNREVDRIRWVRLDEAGELLSYQHDVRLLESLAAGRFANLAATSTD